MEELWLYLHLQCGRTQEILYELNKIKENTRDESFINKYKLLMETPVYVDLMGLSLQGLRRSQRH